MKRLELGLKQLLVGSGSIILEGLLCAKDALDVRIFIYYIYELQAHSFKGLKALSELKRRALTGLDGNVRTLGTRSMLIRSPGATWKAMMTIEICPVNEIERWSNALELDLKG
ncbi:hypothetical protein Tco_0450435 [Tanacetum coccineum]